MGEINVAIADDNERILDLLGEIISSDKELNLSERRTMERMRTI